MNNCVVFQYKGKFAHFLRAEANSSAPSYPFPSRTVLLGLAGAILGLSKDSSQEILKDANFAVSGKAETTHWHTANLRKDPPTPISLTIKKSDKGSSKGQRNTIITQEWLFNPNYTVWTQMPVQYHNEFEQRIKSRTWHFSPSLGLSEMGADLIYLGSHEIVSLKSDFYNINTVALKKKIELDLKTALEKNSVIKSLKMPRNVNDKREFYHEYYCYDVTGKPIYAKTDNAFNIGDNIIMWL